MNSLQAGLIGVSVLVIALFAAWMWWQTWRNNRPQKPAHSAPPPSAAVVDANSVLGEPFEVPRIETTRAERGEPVLHEQASDAAHAPIIATRDDVEHVPQVTRAVEREEPSYVHDDHVVSNEPMQPVADVPSTVAARDAAPPVARSAALPTTLPLDDRLNVYALVSARDGQAIDCQDFVSLADRSLAWGRVFRMSAWEYVEDLASGGAVQSLCLGMPIASRAGPISTSDALGWKNEVSVIAGRHDLEVSFGGDVSVGERAAELDQFLAAVDVICVLYLVRKDGGAWSGTRLRGTLEANGFRLQADGRFVYFEVESETPIFSAVDGFERSFTPERLRTENVNALRLVFEASNVANPVARFDVYRQTLRALARLLESDIKDNDGVNVGDNEFAVLRADVQAGSNALEQAGIECGSPTAQALFR
ncbi:MAG: cell division protein ZipA C-terminal FtsZ-binding domain-containing protein [Casimicrobium sp.]